MEQSPPGVIPPIVLVNKGGGVVPCPVSHLRCNRKGLNGFFIIFEVFSLFIFCFTFNLSLFYSCRTISIIVIDDSTYANLVSMCVFHQVL